MKRLPQFLLASSIAFASPGASAGESQPVEMPARGDRLAADYFRSETTLLAERSLADIRTIEDWAARRGEYRRQLQEMLGLWPLPERTDLQPVITGRLEADQFTVEKLHFQASPRLYVTGNLYLPKKQEKPAPTILYVCGHSRQSTNGVSLGNKTGYQHHGAWFARNGYVCLTIDTVQLGEIEGLHHGTYRQGMWWWNSRGYTPAGVEEAGYIEAADRPPCVLRWPSRETKKCIDRLALRAETGRQLKVQRIIALSLLLGTLVLGGTPASAEEKINSIQSALGSTTISGYVDSSAAWQIESPRPHGFRGWLRAFLHRLRIHPN